MKKNKMNIKRILYFAALTLIIFFIFDRAAYLLFRNISNQFYRESQPDSETGKISEEVKNYYDTLILGSSRTRQGIHPWYLYRDLGLKAYKNARAGQYLKYNYYYYNLFKKKYKTPGYLIYGYDYFIFRLKSSRRRMNNLSDRQEEMAADTGSEPMAPLLNITRYPSLLLLKKEQINTFWIDLIDHLSKEEKAIDHGNLISGFRGAKTSIPKDLLKEPLTWEKKNYVGYPGHEGKYLDLLFDQLEADQVQVFLVILPDFISVYRTNFEREAFIREAESLFRKYPNVTILNYYSPEKFDIHNPRYFRDGKYGIINSHLSFYGAKILNKKLCRDIKKIIRSVK